MKLTHMLSAVMAVSMVANVAAKPALTLEYIQNNFETCAEHYRTYGSEDRARIANKAINSEHYVRDLSDKEEEIQRKNQEAQSQCEHQESQSQYTHQEEQSQRASRNLYFTYTGLGLATTGVIAAGVYYYMNPETAQAHYDVVNNSRVADYTRKGCDWVANTQAAQTVGEWTRNTCNSASDKLASLWTRAFGQDAPTAQVCDEAVNSVDPYPNMYADNTMFENHAYEDYIDTSVSESVVNNAEAENVDTSVPEVTQMAGNALFGLCEIVATIFQS